MPIFRRTVGSRLLSTGDQRLANPTPCYGRCRQPDIVRQAESRYVQIELAGPLTRGQTVVDWFDLTGQPPNASLVLEVDQERFLELLRLALV
jgi:inosine-uridine nucleoside N-ribohydrolase